MNCAEFFQVPSARRVLRVQSTFRVCLCLSLLLHGLLLAVATALRVPRGEPGIGGPLPALNVRLLMTTDRVEAPPAPHPPVAVGVATPQKPSAVIGVARSPRPTVQSVPARSTVPLEKDVVVPSEPEPRTEPSFDVDDLRVQARSLARASPESLVRSPGPHRNLAPAAPQGALDRPTIEALSRRLGKTLVVTGEQRMSDGSRLIRFAGNTCLHIPQHLPDWQISTMGPTVLVATNCL